MTISSNGSPPPSNGSLPHDPASFLLGLEIGQLRARMDSLERYLLQQARVQSIIMDGLTLILKRCATPSPTPTTTSQTTPPKASTGSVRATSSTLTPLIRKLARKASPELGIWLLTRVGGWLLPYLLPLAVRVWGIVKAYLKWLEPLWRASFG